MKKITMNKDILALLLTITLIAGIIIARFVFKNNCIKNNGKFIDGINGFNCIYDNSRNNE